MPFSLATAEEPLHSEADAREWRYKQLLRIATEAGAEHVLTGAWASAKPLQQPPPPLLPLFVLQKSHELWQEATQSICSPVCRRVQTSASTPLPLPRSSESSTNYGKRRHGAHAHRYAGVTRAYSAKHRPPPCPVFPRHPIKARYQRLSGLRLAASNSQGVGTRAPLMCVRSPGVSAGEAAVAEAAARENASAPWVFTGFFWLRVLQNYVQVHETF
eukprot:365469-Chlamydomonas_euryale.AAC.11